MPARILASLAVILLAACSSPAEVAERTGQADGAKASASASPSNMEGRKVDEDNALYSYGFSYPAAVAAHPDLVKELESEAAKAKAELIASAKSAQADAKANDFPFNPYGWSQEWQLVADLPAYLSLSGMAWNYEGGAHGMYGMEGLIWDKANRRSFASEELFQSPSYLSSTMGDALCAALNKERVAKGMEPSTEEDPIFPACPSLDEATILVGSSNGKTFDRITVWYGPYVAGSYAEGAYELDFPMTAAMLEAVKPAYRGAFSVKR